MPAFVIYIESPAGVRMSYVADAYDGYAAAATAARRMRVDELKAVSSVRFAPFDLMTSVEPEKVREIALGE